VRYSPPARAASASIAFQRRFLVAIARAKSGKMSLRTAYFEEGLSNVKTLAIDQRIQRITY
jgi:hypothetical protein